MPATRTFTHETGAVLHYSARGTGPVVLALHGAYSTHEEIEAVVEPIFTSGDSSRRLYPDLPGMGATPSHEAVRSTNDVVDLLDDFVSCEVGSEPFLIVGHSFGAHLARGLAARRPHQVGGIALICPMVAPNTAEEHVIVRSLGEPSTLIDPSHVDEFFDYFVIHTPSTAARFDQAVVPSLDRFDAEVVAQLMSDPALCPDPDRVVFSAPTLVLTGRHDSLVGFRSQLELIGRYPGATHVVLADAGHALPHEHPDLTHHLLSDWLARARSN